MILGPTRIANGNAMSSPAETRYSAGFKTMAPHKFFLLGRTSLLNFTFFGGGQGGANLPYGVKAMRRFLNSNFLICEDE